MSRNLTLNAMLTSIRTLRWNLKFEWRVVGHVAKLRDIGGSIYRRRGVALFVDHKPDLLFVAENHIKKPLLSIVIAAVFVLPVMLNQRVKRSLPALILLRVTALLRITALLRGTHCGHA
jgi:hypothetical protein